ncbi:hypothetical protein IWX50DRAFT_620488 [Phyllosticta citricarpa]|uniref:Uncharacterized protein n=1 Tax=Phyllosticta citricarpa TaxID=55181 RepID=A0ABR1MBT0_9PEZI
MSASTGWRGDSISIASIHCQKFRFSSAPQNRSSPHILSTFQRENLWNQILLHLLLESNGFTCKPCTSNNYAWNGNCFKNFYSANSTSSSSIYNSSTFGSSYSSNKSSAANTSTSSRESRHYRIQSSLPDFSKMGRVFRILTISAVLAAASPLPALPGTPSPQAHQGETRPLSGDKTKGFADELVNGIKTSYAKGIALATGDSPIAVDVPKGVPVEVDQRQNGIGVSVGRFGVDVGKGGHGVDVDAGKAGAGVNVGKEKSKAGTKREVSDVDQDWSLARRDDLVDVANIPYMHTGPVDTTHREDQPSNENRIQARDNDLHDDDWHGGRRGRGNRGGFRNDRWGGRGGGWGGRGGGWGGRGGGWGGRGRGWNRIASVDEADLAGSQSSNSPISFNPPATNNQGSGLAGSRNPSKPANSFDETDHSHSAPVGETGESNQSDSTNSIPMPDTDNAPTPTGESSPVIVPNPFNQTGSNDQQFGSNDQSDGSTDQTNGSNDQSDESDGGLIIDNGGDDQQDEGSDHDNNNNKVKRDVIRCNGDDDDDNRLSCFCDDRNNRYGRNTRNGNRVVLDRDHDLNRRDLERRDVDTKTLSRRHWHHHGGDNWGLANVGVDVDLEEHHDWDWDDDWRPRRGGNNGGVAVGVGPGGAVGVVGGGDEW